MSTHLIEKFGNRVSSDDFVLAGKALGGLVRLSLILRGS
jgi:hypothetical protein